MEVKELRAVVVGWPGGLAPERVLGAVKGATKVEVFFERITDNRGAMVVSFVSAGLRQAAVEAGPVEIQFGRRTAKVVFCRAYSSRSSCNSWHRVRTWYEDSVGN